MNKNNKSVKKRNQRITLKKKIHGGSKNNNSVKKRKSMKKTMNAGSIHSIVKTFRNMNAKPNTVQPLDENFIINIYFTKETEWFDLKQNYPNMYNGNKYNT